MKKNPKNNSSDSSGGNPSDSAPSGRNVGPGTPPNRYMKYSGMAFQLIAGIVLGYWLGKKLDEWMGNKAPWFTIGLSLFFTVGSLVLIIRDLMKEG